MTRDEMDAVILKRWPDPAYSTQDVADEVGRARWVIKDAADRLGMLAKPYSQTMRSLRKFGPRNDESKVRAIKRADELERRTRAQQKAEDARVAAIYARIGPYTDDPRASPPLPLKPSGWEPRPVSERLRHSPIGCAAAMTAGN